MGPGPGGGQGRGRGVPPPGRLLGGCTLLLLLLLHWCGWPPPPPLGVAQVHAAIPWDPLLPLALSEGEGEWSVLEEGRPPCPYQCAGAGVCTPEGCSCPLADPTTNRTYFTPPAEDCSAYGMAAFGWAFPIYQWGWVFIFLVAFLSLIALNIADIQHSTLNFSPRAYHLSIRGFCKGLLPFAPFLKASYLILDPYGLYAVAPAMLRRSLYSISFIIILAIYGLLLYYWVKVYQLNSQRFDALHRHVSLGNMLLVVFLGLVFSVWTTAALAASDQYFFLITFTLVGLCLLLTVPFSIHYGRKLTLLLGQKESLALLQGTGTAHFGALYRQILLLTYGPACFVLSTFFTMLLVQLFMRSNPDLFLIGESLLMASECAIFIVFAHVLYGKGASAGGLIQWSEE